jgi:hypothetical protein
MNYKANRFPDGELLQSFLFANHFIYDSYELVQSFFFFGAMEGYHWL